MLTTPLPNIPKNTHVIVNDLVFKQPDDIIAQRLYDLGFIPGESVYIVAKTPFKKGPLVVKTSQSRFALRNAEAARILVTHPL